MWTRLRPTEVARAGRQGPCRGRDGVIGRERGRGEGWGPSLVFLAQLHNS